VNGLLPIDLSYDTAGQLEEMLQDTGAAERRTRFVYDAAGFLAEVVGPLLRPTDFTYDAAGRITRQTLPDGRFIDFTYDANGNLTSLTPPGQPAHVFRYTPVDLEAEYEPPALAGIPDPRSFFDYDLGRNLDLVTRPDGATIDFQYDAAGRLAAILRPAGATSFGYDPATGNLATILAPGGEGLAFGYDGSLLTATTWSGTVAGTVSRSCDDDFRLASQSVNGAQTVAFAYDGDGLLTQVDRNGSPEAVYSYDANGNRLSETTAAGTTSASYDAQDRLVQYGSTSYAFSAAGDLVSKTDTATGETTGYAYDALGNLLQVSLPDGSIPSRA
jgi:YD repeat-containing protein